MARNLADLDSEILLAIAQHLILTSSNSFTAGQFNSLPPYNPTSFRNNLSSRYPPSTASSSRTDINSLLNSSTSNSNSTQYRPLNGNLPASHRQGPSTSFPRPRPGYLLPLLLTCRKLHASLSVEGHPKLYSWLYEATFDTAAIKRRWTQATIPSWHFNGNATGYPDTTVVESHRSKRQKLDRRRHISPTASQSTSSNEFFDVSGDPSFFAEEYRERFCIFSRFKALHLQYADAGIQDQKATMLDSQLVSDLWMIWFMITEHDEKNIPVILELAYLDNSLDFLYQKVYLDDALAAGLPPSTITKALTAWIIIRLGLTTMLENSPEEVDEKVFALAPFALASFKYPLWIAPWTFRVLPLIKVAESEEELRLISKPNAFMPDLTPRELGVPVKRFGREWDVLPNFYADAAGLIFDGMLDRHPRMISLGKKTGTPSYHAAFPHLSGPVPKPHFANGLQSSENKSPQMEGEVTQHHDYFPHQSMPDLAQQLISTQYDQDFMRSMSCASPITSPGLPALFYRNKIAGTWKGAYIFFDFEAYRRLLAGNLRSLYEGAYGHQECEWNILESVINVRLDRLGGNGGFLSAGFKLDQSAEEARREAQMPPEERGWEPCPDETALDRPGWTKEIILTGQCRHSWGTSEIYGRVRSWDGLVILRQDFSHRAIGRWLYTGYIHAGGLLVGRWRDTFTPENQRGYENAFHLHRVSSSVNPPTRWSESDYRRYDPPSTSSTPSYRALSSSVYSVSDMPSKTQSPVERASSAASTHSYASTATPRAETTNLPILPPIRTTSWTPSLTLQKASPARVQLPSLHSSIEEEDTP
ncbi:hypothetical protein QFC22_004627 [Naganishia vaughanmartiniae]|uniref:Uncharacterized protein n=1 Tax=Naganishia vaughanmartiniae TaxID=1424756 RepID=A0ACC2X0S0_9TREE|nr:hypothetical protein QFC22_004627 [Naganishia vaughanmartiniae]